MTLSRIKDEKSIFVKMEQIVWVENSDSKSWYYDSIGIYDAIKNTYIVKGDLIDNSAY